MLDAAKFIVFWSTSNVEAALSSLRSKEAAKVRVALRLARRGVNIRRRSILYAVAERAAWLEAMGVDRQTATEVLLSEYRLRAEEHMRTISSAFNTVVFIAAMTFLMSIVISMLALLSPDASKYASAFSIFALMTAFMLEGIIEPVKRWDYRVTALAMAPAALSLFWPQALYAVPIAAALYAVWYIPQRREAEEELTMALRGRLQAASTPLAKEALEIIKAVRMSGAYYLQSAAEFIMRIIEHYYKSIRFSGLIRAFVVISLVFVMVMAINSLQKPLAEMVEKAKSGPTSLPFQLYVPEFKQTVLVAAFIAALIAGRMTESYAAAPLYTPVMLLSLLV
jgi:hypothetical protein